MTRVARWCWIPLLAFALAACGTQAPPQGESASPQGAASAPVAAPSPASTPAPTDTAADAGADPAPATDAPTAPAPASDSAASDPRDATQRPSADLVQDGVDYACRSDADCTVKDIGSCCGYAPACVNIDSATFPDKVKAECASQGMSSICGFAEIAGCQCVEGRCTDVPGPAPSPSSLK